jgi:hypothetical protein
LRLEVFAEERKMKTKEDILKEHGITEHALMQKIKLHIVLGKILNCKEHCQFFNKETLCKVANLCYKYPYLPDGSKCVWKYLPKKED